MIEPKRYGGRPEKTWTVEAEPGQTAQEIVDDDTWDERDLVHQLARDLLAAQARVRELEEEVASKGRMMHRIFKLGLERQAAFDRRSTELEAMVARVADALCDALEGEASLAAALGDGGKRGG